MATAEETELLLCIGPGGLGPGQGDLLIQLLNCFY